MQRVIIFSSGRDCEGFAQKHMFSVEKQRQNYDNILEIVVDDASNDTTWSDIASFFKDDKKYYFNRHYSNHGLLYNMMRYLDPVIEDDDIIVWLDLDDWFIDDFAIEKIVKTYQEKNIWTTYGMYKCSNEYTISNYGYDYNCMKNKLYRESPWLWQHPRTFKGFLWKAIDKSTFMQNGEYMTFACDLAIGFAILEMCPPEKIHRFNDVFVMYNRNAGNHEDLINRPKQVENEAYFRSLPKYETLIR